MPIFDSTSTRFAGMPSCERVAGVEARDIVVHAVERDGFRRPAVPSSEGVAVDSIEPFDERPPPHCNKICGAIRLAERGVEGSAVLTDTDIAMLEDFAGWTFHPVRWRHAWSEPPTLPFEFWKTCSRLPGSRSDGLEPLDWVPEERTVSGHGNGGLYIIPGAMLSTVAHSWAHWAKWLMDHVAILEDFPRHIDQPSMALALSDLGITPRRLDIRWNFPAHNPARIPTNSTARR